MKTDPQVSLFDLVMCVSEVIDLVDPAVSDHHKRVAYLATSLAAELGFSPKERADLLLAGILHDVGILTQQERLASWQFEMRFAPTHPEIGARLLEVFAPLASAAPLVRHHHVIWDDGRGRESQGQPVPMGCHLLHLADRVTVLMQPGREILGQVPEIVATITAHAGKMFVPEYVEVFAALAVREYIWLDLTLPSIGAVLHRLAPSEMLELGSTALLELANMFRRVIDFRSPFTATHSSGVAASAEALARLVGFSDHECHLMLVAGSLHDLGKLAVPTTILEKPGKLTPEEFAVIRGHTFQGYRCLERIPAFHQVNTWGSLHHERLDGQGYPFHLTAADLCLGSRIMAVADVFTAITEDRPYRKGMTHEEAWNVLARMATDGAIDPMLVHLLETHFDEVAEQRQAAQTASLATYRQFRLLQNADAETAPDKTTRHSDAADDSLIAEARTLSHH
jgi:HD-GYP domain-containing protein (c-di-GMP phosphodiesterase class II)